MPIGTESAMSRTQSWYFRCFICKEMKAGEQCAFVLRVFVDSDVTGLWTGKEGLVLELY